MSTASPRFSAAALTDRGRKRPSNEDAFGYSVESGVYVVCDGMGGAAAGEVASQQAVEEVLAVLCQPQPAAGEVALDELAVRAVKAANESIFVRARRNPSLSGMGTTLVALLSRGSRLLIVNVGDSRCYRMRDAILEQLTLDHSLVEEQVRMGRMTPAEALRSPMRNVITRALGTQQQITPDLFEEAAVAGDYYLLCSDGLTRELSDERIEALLNTDAPLEERVKALVEAAKDSGGQDNITCVLVRVDE